MVTGTGDWAIGSGRVKSVGLGRLVWGVDALALDATRCEVSHVVRAVTRWHTILRSGHGACPDTGTLLTVLAVPDWYPEMASLFWVGDVDPGRHVPFPISISERVQSVGSMHCIASMPRWISRRQGGTGRHVRD